MLTSLPYWSSAEFQPYAKPIRIWSSNVKPKWEMENQGQEWDHSPLPWQRPRWVGIKFWLNLKSRQQKLGTIMIDMKTCEGKKGESRDNIKVGTLICEWNPEHFQRKCVTFGTKNLWFWKPQSLSSLFWCVGLNATPAITTLISICLMGCHSFHQTSWTFFLFFIMKFDSTFHHLSPSSDHLSRLPLTISCIKPLWDLSGWIKIWFFHINMWTFFFFIMKSDLIQLDNLTTFDHTTNIFQNNYP